MKLIVGLGNPGRKYTNTRHNIGFKTVDKIADIIYLSLKKSKEDYLIGQRSYKGNRIILLKPLTYMNDSGIAVNEIINKYNILYEDLLVICDDLNIILGTIRFRNKSTSGGNKGLESIINKINTIDFSRLRIGIKNESKFDDAADFVLSKFDKSDSKRVNEIINVAAEAALYWFESDIDKAMNEYNGIIID